jgi:ubiquinone/menaquinone biosynthesis C-methylase UbiE
MGIEEERTSAFELARTADLMRLVPKNRSSVLDVGARDGHFSKLLTQDFQAVVALDLEKPGFSHPGVRTVAGNITRLEFADNAFYCVFCAGVLEHISELSRACAELRRVARYEVLIGVRYKQDTRVRRVTCRACGRPGPP